MLALAGQTAGPLWRTFFEGNHGYPRGDKCYENSTGNAEHISYFFYSILN